MVIQGIIEDPGVMTEESVIALILETGVVNTGVLDPLPFQGLLIDILTVILVAESRGLVPSGVIPDLQETGTIMNQTFQIEQSMIRSRI